MKKFINYAMELPKKDDVKDFKAALNNSTLLFVIKCTDDEYLISLTDGYAFHVCNVFLRSLGFTDAYFETYDQWLMMIERYRAEYSGKPKVNKYGIVTRGFTVKQCIERHKTFWDNWPYFNEPRRVWRDEYDRLCIEYVRKDDLTTAFYRYTVENGLIVWG